jgi:hypothetical protein
MEQSKLGYRGTPAKGDRIQNRQGRGAEPNLATQPTRHWLAFGRAGRQLRFPPISLILCSPRGSLSTLTIRRLDRPGVDPNCRSSVSLGNCVSNVSPTLIVNPAIDVCRLTRDWNG